MIFVNLYEAYNKEEDFRVLITAWNEDEALEIAQQYQKDTNLEGEFEIRKEYSDPKTTHYDCDYVLSKEDLKY